MAKLSFVAHLRYILATDIAGFLFGALLLILVSRVRSLLSPLAFVLLLAALALGFCLDVLVWVFRGIRVVELDEASITVYRGTSMKAWTVTQENVRRMKILRRLGRRTLLIHATGLRAVRITEEAFSREAFTRFLTAVSAWGTDPSRN